MSKHEIHPEGYEYELPEYVDLLFRVGGWKNHVRTSDQDTPLSEEPLDETSSLYAGVADVMLRTGRGKTHFNSSEYPLPELSPLKQEEQVRILYAQGKRIQKVINQLLPSAHLLTNGITLKAEGGGQSTLFLKTPESKDFSSITFTSLDTSISVMGNPRLSTSHFLTVGSMRDPEEQVMTEVAYYKKHGALPPRPLTDRFSFYFSGNGESHVLYEPALTIEAIKQGNFSMPIESRQLQAMGATVPKKAMMKVWDTVMSSH